MRLNIFSPRRGEDAKKKTGEGAGPTLDFYRESVIDDFTTRTLQMRADSINESERSIEAVISTETPATVMDWSNWRLIREVLIPEGCVSDDQVPLLKDHNRSNSEMVLGAARNINPAKSGVTARLFFEDDTWRKEAAVVEPIWQKVRQRFLRAVSVGYQALVYTDIEPGQKATIAGRSFEGGVDGLRVTTQWKLKEVSTTPIGADDKAKMRSQFDKREIGVPGSGLGGQPGGGPSHNAGGSSVNFRKEVAFVMNELLKRYLISLGCRADASEEEFKKFLESLSVVQREVAELVIRQVEQGQAGAGTPTPEGQRSAVGTEGAGSTPETPSALTSVDAQRIATEVLAAERGRVTAIRTAAGTEIPGEMVERAISEGWDLTRANAEFLRVYRENRGSSVGGGAPNIHVQPHATRDALASALMIRLGTDPVNSRASETIRAEQARNAELGQRFAYLSAFDFCREIVAITGARDPDSGGVPSSREGYIRAAISSGALTHIFTTNVNARLIPAYAEAPDTTRGWVGEEDVPDFKEVEDIQLSQGGNLDLLPRGSEATHANRSDESVGYKVARYAKQFVVDEQDIIDDRLGALQTMPVSMAQASARLRPNLVYSILRANPTMGDGIALFDALHANTATDAMSSTTIKGIIAKMIKQTKDGENLNIQPTHVVTTTALKDTIEGLISSTQIVLAGTAGAVTEKGNANTLYNVMTPVIDARLDNGVTSPFSKVTYAGSDTAWYLVAAMYPAIKVAYLMGTSRTPQVRSFVLDRGRWGIGWDIKHDIGAAAVDWRGIQRGNV